MSKDRKDDQASKKKGPAIRVHGPTLTTFDRSLEDMLKELEDGFQASVADPGKPGRGKPRR